MKFDYDYPATVVVAELPSALQQADYEGMLVEMPAVFYRMWSFPSIMSQRADPNRQQVVPLFVGAKIVVPATDARPFSSSVAILVGAAVLLVAAILCWVVFSQRREQKTRARALPKVIDIQE
jgi:hypothetical protein